MNVSATMATGRGARGECFGTGSTAERRFPWILAVLLAFGVAGCAARGERPPDRNQGPEAPADPNIGSLPGTGDEPECLSNSDVIDLVVSGEQDAAIIARFADSTGCFDLSTAGMLELRNAGVSPAVIAAMARAARQDEH